MNLWLKVYWIFCLYSVYCIKNNFTNEHLINYSIECIKEYIETHRLMIIVKSTNKFFNISLPGMNEIVNNFPVTILNINELQDQDYHQYGYIISMRTLLIERSNKNSLTIMFVYVDKTMNATQELVEYIEFFVDFTATIKRPKCLIYLFMNGGEVHLHNFFKFSWTYNFLDITVIELTQQNASREFMPPEISYIANLHYYNPFSYEYKKQTFDESIAVFPDKLKNLHGYTLSTGFYSIEPVFYFENDKYTGMSSLRGVEPRIINVISEKVNFSFSTNAPDPGLNLVPGIMNNSIDFSMSSFATLYRPTNDMSFEFSIHIYSLANTLIVRQEPQYKIEIASEALDVLRIFIFVVITFSITVWVLGLDPKTWSVYNIIQITIGNAPEDELKGVGERVLYLTLLTVYITSTSVLLDILMSINFSQQTFIDFKTLEDVVNANVISCITRLPSISINNTDDTYLTEIMKTSTTDCDDCWKSLIEKTGNFNGCERNAIFGRAMANIFSKNIDGWIISFVEQPLSPSWSGLLFPGTSPLVDRFNGVIRILFESGMIKRWFDNEEQILELKIRNKRYFSRKDKEYTDSDDVDEIYKNMIFLMLFGYFISCCIFILEMVWEIVKKKIELTGYRFRFHKKN